MYKLTFLQVFDLMRTFFNLKYDETESEDLNIIVGSFQLWFDKYNEKGDPNTRDSAAWEDWIDAIEKTMKENHIAENYREIKYDEELSFLCMRNYLYLFVDMFGYEDASKLLKKIDNARHTKGDPIWDLWVASIEHVLNGTYELDASYDPFTYERRN